MPKGCGFNAEKDLPEYCSKPESPSYDCLVRECPFLDFNSCENTLCYINEKSEMEKGILFGGDMEIDGDITYNIERWKRVSTAAVIASYEEYMREMAKQQSIRRSL